MVKEWEIKELAAKAQNQPAPHLVVSEGAAL
jgi:hypothetical protein